MLLEHIKSSYPLPAAALIDVMERVCSMSDQSTTSLSSASESELKTWMVANLIERWDELKLSHRDDLNRLLGSHESIRKAVQEELIALPASRKRGFEHYLIAENTRVD
jgi:hypothetical protein